LDVGIFSPLAKAYKSRIQQNSIYGTERITNEQFLMHFQAARQEAISARNIESAWRAVGLIPYNPSPILEKYRPKTPPFSDAIDGNGVEKINEMVAQLLRVSNTTPIQDNLHQRHGVDSAGRQGGSSIHE
jgi:hypothetical protein